MKSSRPALLLPALFLFLTLPAAADVRPKPTVEGPPQAAIEGTVTSINIPFVGGGPIVTLLDGLVHFDATDATVRFSSGIAGTTADLEIGQRLVAFVESTQAMPKAKSIVVLAQRTDVTFTGAVERFDLTARTLTVLGFAVKVTARTIYGGPRDGTGQAGLEDLKVGDLVLVAATAETQALVATRVMKLAPSPIPTSRLHGVVESIGTDSWTIVRGDGTKDVVKVDAETKVVGSPKVGDEVDILSRPLPDGSLLALLIAASDPLPTVPTERYQGVVRSISPTSWTIGPKVGEGPDRIFDVDGSTRVIGDPKVGDEVGILASKQVNGTYLAVAIAKLTTAPPVGTQVVLEGIVNRVDPEGMMGVATWMVGDTKVLVTRMTAVSGAPKAGDTVRVEGFRGPDGIVMAAKVAKL
ncbi:MAG: hypothetical protein IPP07_26500 [Holophagales bacterium]|nr:hypothetical protein [Holophagales bacterium]MBK9968218.1 hypothetical protein [Holophagales bacterium]